MASNTFLINLKLIFANHFGSFSATTMRGHFMTLVDGDELELQPSRYDLYRGAQPSRFFARRLLTRNEENIGGPPVAGVAQL
jgi:hypothetical protein